MKDMKTLIQRMLNKYEGDDVAGYIADELDHIRNIQSDIANLENQIRIHKDTYKKAIELAENQIKKIQTTRCKHWTSTYHADPSGGYDSFTKCDQCGYVVDRNEEPCGYDG